MNEPLSPPVWWLVPLWSVAALVCVALWSGKRLGGRWLLAGLAGFAVVAAMPLLPVVKANQPQQPPTQVVYRFDDHRWLELKGWMCEGALTYVDAKQNIRTEVAAHFFRIVFFPYIHPSERYIAIPLDDLSGILMSRDGGRTFGPEDAKIDVADSAPYDNTIPTPDDVRQFVVVDDRGYIETKDGRLLQSSLSIGEYWGIDYIDYLKPGQKQYLNLYDRPGFQDMKSHIPEVKNYKGWTHMKCDPNIGVVAPKTSLEGVPGVIYAVEAYTPGAPVYFGWKAYRKMYPPQQDVDSG